MCLFPNIKYGFTGTQRFDESNARHVGVVTTLLQRLKIKQATEFTTGACVGIDDFVYRKCYELYPEAWHRVIVPANRSKVVIPEPAPNVEIIYMPEGSSYRDRNKRILDFTDFLYVIPFDKLEVMYSGTWMTHNIAKDRKIPLEVVSLCRTAQNL